MPRYGEDQCEECGGIRVAKSTLCVNCLVRQGYEDGRRRLEMESVIEAIKKQSEERLRVLLELARVGFRKDQEIDFLRRETADMIRGIDRLKQEI